MLYLTVHYKKRYQLTVESFSFSTFHHGISHQDLRFGYVYNSLSITRSTQNSFTNAGVGLAGLTFHVPLVLALPSLFKLHAVLERKPAGPGGKLQERFGPDAAKDVKIYNTLDAVLADPDIELVIVGTPNETHYEFTKKILEAGKHGKRYVNSTKLGVL